LHKLAKKSRGKAPISLAISLIKKTSMTIIYNYLQKRLFLLSSLSALFFLVSCQKQPNLTFGPTYVSDNGSANIVVVDTSTAIMSTVYTDSTATAGTGFLMVGNLNDPYFGKISTRAFLQVAPPASQPTLTIFDTYDSIGLILLFKKNNPYYGDTTINQSFVVNQVDSLYQLANYQNGWFSNYSLPLDPTPLGKTSNIIIQPSIPFTSQQAGDTVFIRLNDNLGRQIFNQVFNLSDSIRKTDQWLAWFHGLCVSPDPGSQGAIYGFQDSAVMRIFYRENSLVSTVKYLDFELTNKSNQFNNLKPPDWSGTPLANLKKPTQPVQPPPATLSAATANASYIQTIEGLNVKLAFPYINGIAQRPDYLGVLRALLTVRPVPGSYSTTWRLPPQLGLYATDQNNEIQGIIPATGTSSLQTGNLSLDYFHPLNTTYTYDVTNFVKSQITNQTTNGTTQPALLLSVPAPANTASFTRAVLADPTYPMSQRVTLSVYYISLYPHN
jgi:hypothetical protein